MLVATTALWAGGVPLVLPAEDAVAQTARTHVFDIAAQPLDRALRALAGQTGLQVAYQTSVASGAMAPAVTGRMTSEQALARLLAGSGLSYSFTGANTVAILARGAAVGNISATADGSTSLETITVEGQGAGGTGGYVAASVATATKTDTPLIEVPQAVNVVTRGQIERQGAQNVTEATRYTPGVVATFGDSDSRNDVLQSRGFFVRYNLNGSRLPYGAYSAALARIEPYSLERIDVLKGPSSVMYGQSLPGGLINLTTKMPTETPLREVAIQGGSHGRLQGMFDFSGPVDDDGQFLYRLTGMGRDSGGRVDFGHDKRQFIAPALTWQPTDATSFTVYGQYQKDDTISDYMSLPAAGTLLSSPLGKLPPSRYAGEPGYDGYEREQYTAGYNFKHQFETGWTLRQNLQFNSVDIDTKASPAAMMTGPGRVMRVASHGVGAADTFTVDTNLEGRFETGAVEHKVLLGLDYLHLDDSYRFASGVYGGDFDLYNPVYGAAIPVRIPRIDYNMKRRQVGLYAQDQMQWDNWIVTAGLRQDWVTADSTERLGSSTFHYEDSKLTGRVGLTYLFDNGFAPYLSYSTSFEPIDNVSTTGGPLMPLEGRQVEAGLKYQSADGGSFVTFSAFQIDQKNVTAPNRAPGGIGLLQAGEARVRGFEVEAKTELTPAFSVLASYAYTDSKITKVNVGTEPLLGKALVMVPDHQASVWLDYQFEDGALAGLGLAGGLRYQGKSYGDADNLFEVGGQVLLDAALNYDFGKLDKNFEGLNLRVTATNLLNREYVGFCQNAMQCYYGQGRTINATLKYRW